MNRLVIKSSCGSAQSVRDTFWSKHLFLCKKKLRYIHICTFYFKRNHHLYFTTIFNDNALWPCIGTNLDSVFTMFTTEKEQMARTSQRAGSVEYQQRQCLIETPPKTKRRQGQTWCELTTFLQGPKGRFTALDWSLGQLPPWYLRSNYLVSRTSFL